MKSVVLVILDGWGIAPKSNANAIALANKPNYNRFLEQYPSCQLKASGEAVGLKHGEPGNSEAGHTNLGAGRVVEQDKMFITESIHDSTFYSNNVLLKAFESAKKNKSNVHLIGLLSNGESAHSEPDHLDALLLMAKKQRCENVYLHLFTDGRDTLPKQADELVKKLEITINNIGIGKIATVAGRYYGMDRGNNWERTGLVYEALVFGQGDRASTAFEAIQQSYKKGVTDEFIKPTIIASAEQKVKEKDSLILFNLRSDRARQLVKSFVAPRECNSKIFDCKLFLKFKKINFATMVDFGNDLPVEVAFPMRRVQNTLPDYFEKYQGFRQLYIAEREKFAHVTFFFHGLTPLPERNERRIRIPSKSVATFDRAPEMSACEITDAAIENIKKKIYTLIVINYANVDMLGHTGMIKPTIKAVEVLDEQLGRLYEASRENETTLVVTADHGNAEQMLDPITGETDTTHTNNPVPCMFIDDRLRGKQPKNGLLRDVAPTILKILDLPKPREMSGESLI